MTQDQIRADIQASVPNRNVVDILQAANEAFFDIVAEVGSYQTEKAVRVTAAQQRYAWSDLLPELDGSDNGEAVERILQVRFVECNSHGPVTTVVTADGGDAIQITSAANGLSDGDKVVLKGTGYPLGTAAGAIVNAYDQDKEQEVSNAATNTFQLPVSYQGTAPNNQGIWYEPYAGRNPHVMHPVGQREMDESFPDVYNVTSAQVPTGIVLLTWLLKPPSMDYWTSGVHIPDHVLRRGAHRLIVEQAIDDLTGKERAKTGRLWERVKQMYRGSVPYQHQLAAPFRYQNGIYVLRAGGGDDALTINVYPDMKGY